MTTLADQVAARIRDLRTTRGWSQEQLADAAGLSRDAVSRIERGDRAPRLETLQAIGEAVGTSLPELLDLKKSLPGGGLDGRGGRFAAVERQLTAAEPWLADALATAVKGVVSAQLRAGVRLPRRETDPGLSAPRAREAAMPKRLMKRITPSRKRR